MSRDWDVIPCASQKLHLEQAGFSFDPSTPQPASLVRWAGHGLVIELRETEEVASPAAAVALVVIEALAEGDRRRLAEIRKALLITHHS